MLLLGLLFGGVIGALIVWLLSSGGATGSVGTGPPFDPSKCHNEGRFLVCTGPCAPINGRSCVTIEIDPNGTTRTWCVNGPARYPWIKVDPSTGEVQQGWGVCLF